MVVKFSKTHEWVKIQDNQATVGITDYAQGELGDVVFVELPAVGDKVTQFSNMGTVESTKIASELYAPVSGEVVEVNNELVNNPQLVNESPMDKGWMVKIKLTNPDEIDNLMSDEEYQQFIEQEKRH